MESGVGGGRPGLSGALHCRAPWPLHQPVRPNIPSALPRFRGVDADRPCSHLAREGPAELMTKFQNNRRIGLMAAQVLVPACARGASQFVDVRVDLTSAPVPPVLCCSRVLCMA